MKRRVGIVASIEARQVPRTDDWRTQMHARTVAVRRGALALVFALVALLSALSAGAAPAAAQTANPDPLAANQSGDVARLVVITPYPLTAEGGARARAHVHSRSQCGDAFCTIQRIPPYYVVYAFSGCNTWEVNLKGTYDSHNHGSLSVYLYGKDGRFMADYWGGRDDVVNWNPVGFLHTCAG